MDSRAARNAAGSGSASANVPRYSNIAIVLHWAIAALVVTLVVLGFYMTGLPRNTADRAYFVNLHKSLGVLTLVLVVVRAGWRLSHKPPPLPASTPAWQQRGAALSHGLLYAAMLLQPVTGYLMSSFGKFGVRFFGVPLPVAGWPDPVVARMVRERAPSDRLRVDLAGRDSRHGCRRSRPAGPRRRFAADAAATLALRTCPHRLSTRPNYLQTCRAIRRWFSPMILRTSSFVAASQ